MSDSYLYCDEHGGIVPTEDIEFSKGEITGNDFPNCKIHPNSMVEVRDIKYIKDKYAFTMFEDRRHLE